MRSIIALLGVVSCTGGCHRAASEAEVYLSDYGAEVRCSSGAVPVEAPLNMGVEKTMVLVSQCSVELSALTVATSCGCTSAVLSDTTLQPGKSITLSLAFDPETLLVHRRVRAVVRHKAAPQDPYVIPANYSNTQALDGWRIIPSPRELSIDVPWSPGYCQRWKVSIDAGGEIAIGSLSASASSPFIHCAFAKATSPHRENLEVEIRNPPIGRIDEKVQVRVSRRGDVYYATIPIAGEFLSPFYCEPSIVTVMKDQATGKATASVKVTRRETGMRFPRITVSGDWKLRDVKPIGNSQWEVCVVSGEADPTRVGYGVLTLKGDWQGSDVVVPLTAASAK